LFSKLVHSTYALYAVSVRRCGILPSGFLQIPPHGGHPCRWLMIPTTKLIADFHRQVTTHVGRTKKVRFVWITNLNINKNNIVKIAKGARLRWKIENEGFNVQKNRGFNLEHPYSQNEIAMKNFYLLLQIACIISQIMEKGSLLRQKIVKDFGSVTGLFEQLLEDLRTKFIGSSFSNKPIQISSFP